MLNISTLNFNMKMTFYIKMIMTAVKSEAIVCQL